MRTLCLGLLLAGFAATALPAAIERNLSDEALDEAISMARRARDDNRSAFHRSYVFPTGATPVVSISLVTEFRRVVLAAEEALRFGNHLFARREAREAIANHRNTFTVVADVVYHPQNAFATVPSYAVRIIPKEGSEIGSYGVRVTARYGLQSVPTPSNPPYYPFPPPTLPSGPGADSILGAWVEATFPADAVNPKELALVAVSEQGKDVARVSVDFSSIR